MRSQHLQGAPTASSCEYGHWLSYAFAAAEQIYSEEAAGFESKGYGQCYRGRGNIIRCILQFVSVYLTNKLDENSFMKLLQTLNLLASILLTGSLSTKYRVVMNS